MKPDQAEVRRIKNFLIAGSIGFAVDAGFLYLLSIYVDPIFARLGSFAAAVCATWLINSVYTFDGKLKRFYAYLTGQLLGMGINFAVFVGMLSVLSESKFKLLIGLAASSIVAMTFNYLAMRFWVFAKH